MRKRSKTNTPIKNEYAEGMKAGGKTKMKAKCRSKAKTPCCRGMGAATRGGGYSRTG